MTRTPAVLLAVLALAASGCGGDDEPASSGASTDASAAPASGGPGAVSMKDIAFAPKDLTVKVGEKVTWTNEDAVEHDVESEDGTTIDSELFGKGETFEYTPDKAGTIAYVCTVHPGMAGTLTVTE